jgi:hypothetical protein
MSQKQSAWYCSLLLSYWKSKREHEAVSNIETKGAEWIMNVLVWSLPWVDVGGRWTEAFTRNPFGKSGYEIYCHRSQLEGEPVSLMKEVKPWWELGGRPVLWGYSNGN